MPVTRRFGPVAVTALTDAVGPFFQPRVHAFPDASAAHWQAADRLDPLAVRSGEWLLRFRCFLLRPDGGPTVLIDTGIGGTDAPARTWAPVPGSLPAELAAAGIAPDDVDTVVLTHLHTDHIGWSVEGTTPYFGHARYLVPRADIEAIGSLNPAVDAWLLDPLRRTGQLCAVEGDVDLAPGLRVVATPGHTPGHQSVLLTGGEDAVLFTGDLLVHAIQLVDPTLAYAHDHDPDLASRSRVSRLDEHDGVLATPHLGQPFTPWRERSGHGERN